MLQKKPSSSVLIKLQSWNKCTAGRGSERVIKRNEEKADHDCMLAKSWRGTSSHGATGTQQLLQ
jgi:hypothetical protein